MQGKINRCRHTDNPAGRHSIRTNQRPPPPSPIFYRPDALPAAQPTVSKHWRQAYLHNKWHLNPSSHLATTDMGRTLGQLCSLGEGDLGPHLAQCGQGWGLPASQVSSASDQPFGHSTPTSQTRQTERTDRQDRTDNGPIAQGKPFYKQSPKNQTSFPSVMTTNVLPRFLWITA